MLCKHLREHQREGVQFMFGCVMGFRDFQGSGCILADDMGLGKTLQAVTLLWTLLTQGTSDQSICRRGLVVCPTSLVRAFAIRLLPLRLCHPLASSAPSPSVCFLCAFTIHLLPLFTICLLPLFTIRLLPLFTIRLLPLIHGDVPVSVSLTSCSQVTNWANEFTKCAAPPNARFS
jgi:hypothetical protein